MINGDPHRVADALQLKKIGSEYKGPCPLCGGQDRFHVRQGTHSDFLIHCRQGCSFPDLMRELKSRGLIEGDQFVRPSYRRQNLELADHAILIMESAARRGDSIIPSDDESFTRLAQFVDRERSRRIVDLLRILRGNK